MEEGGPSFQIIFQKPAVTWFHFLKSEKGHIKVISHHHTIIGTKEGGAGKVREECGGRWRWFGWRESEGRVGAICVKIPQPLAFFGFSPHNFLIRAKMHKLKEETKGRTNDPILTHPEWGHKAGGPNAGGRGGGFSFGWMDIGAKKKLKIFQRIWKCPELKSRNN